MNKFFLFLGFAACITTVFFPGCGKKNNPLDNNNQQLTIISSKVSECGGFSGENPVSEKKSQIKENIFWNYEKENSTLTITHYGLMQNCCKDGEITASKSGKTLFLHETFKGEGCRCNCNYDLEITVGGISEEIIDINIDLYDGSSTDIVWSGTVDLSERSGALNGLN